MADPRILITGGSGRLGTALRRLLPDAIAPTHADMDITHFDQVRAAAVAHKPDIVIHCAALASTEGCLAHPRKAFAINAQPRIDAFSARTRMVFLSTDYIFDGERPPYHEGSCAVPVNLYGWTKLRGEGEARQFRNHLILRAPFRDDPPWPYPRAFSDLWTSCDFVSVRAPQIVEAALSDWTGTLHIGGPRRSILELARMASPEVGEMTRAEAGVALPRDTSFDCSKWLSLTKQFRP